MFFSWSLMNQFLLRHLLVALYRVRIVKLHTQRVLRDKYTPRAVRLVGGMSTSLYFAFVTGSKWTAAFRYPNSNQVDGVNLNCLPCPTSIRRKRSNEFTYLHLLVPCIFDTSNTLQSNIATKRLFHRHIITAARMWLINIPLRFPLISCWEGKAFDKKLSGNKVIL